MFRAKISYYVDSQGKQFTYLVSHSVDLEVVERGEILGLDNF